MYDCVVIGGGPCGVACAIYLKQAGYDVIIVEEMIIGGQPFQTKNISNVIGFIGTGEDFISIANKQLEDNDISVIYGSAEIINNELFVDNNRLDCKAIVIATGSSPNKIDLINNAHYCSLCDGVLYKDKEVIVIGSGNSAFSEALNLSNIAKHVNLLISNKFPILANNQLQKQINNLNNVSIVYYDELLANINNKLTLVLNDNNFDLIYDGIFVAIGRTPNITCLKDFNKKLEVDEKYRVIVNNKPVVNLFAGGDVLDKEVKQISTAIADGVLISQNVIKYLRGE